MKASRGMISSVSSRQYPSHTPAIVAGVYNVETLVRQEALAIGRQMQCASIWASVPQKLAQPQAQPAHLVMGQALNPERCNNSAHLDNSHQEGCVSAFELNLNGRLACSQCQWRNHLFSVAIGLACTPTSARLVGLSAVSAPHGAHISKQNQANQSVYRIGRSSRDRPQPASPGGQHRYSGLLLLASCRQTCRND